MGKSKGKMFVSLGLAVFGFMNPAAFLGAGSTACWSGALYGASLGGTLWSATHKPKQDNSNTSKFDAFMNTVDSNARIPVIYGTRKWSGSVAWHKASTDSKTLTKDIILCEADIGGIYGVTANELVISEDIATIINTSYSDASITVFKTNSPTKYDKIMRLHANGKNVDIILCAQCDVNNDHPELRDYNGTQNKLFAHIGQLGDGWQILNPVVNTDDCEQIKDIAVTNCYKKPVQLRTRGLENCSYTFTNGDCPPDNYMEVGGYRKMAWLRAKLRQSDRLNSNSPNVTCIVQGKKITDTRDNTYGYSENPAMIIRDYLLATRYGCGQYIEASMLNEDSFKEIADYCDEVIQYKDANGIVQYEKRYTLNIILDSKKKHIEHLQDMLANFGGFLVFTNNHISLRIEKQTNISYAFTDDTIIENSIGYTLPPIEEAPNRFTITYYDPSQNWTGIKCVCDDSVNQKQRGIIVNKDITLQGCTSQSQALRAARLNRDLIRLCPIVITFQTATMAMHLEPGDVVTVSKKCYPNGQEQWLYKDFPVRILEITEEKGIYSIKAQQYNETIYNDNLGAKIQIPQYTDIINPFMDSIPDVSNLKLSQSYSCQNDGTIINDLIINFDDLNYQFFKQCHIYYSTNINNDWVYCGNTIDNKFVIHNVLAKTQYKIKIVVENTQQRFSSGIITDYILINGKTDLPSDISGFTVNRDNYDSTKLILNWNQANDSDLRGYVIKCNDIKVDEVKSIQYVYTMPKSGTYNFSIFAVNNSGNVSGTPAMANITANIEPEFVSNISVTEHYSNLGSGAYGRALELSFKPNDRYYRYAEIYMSSDNPAMDKINKSWNELTGSMDSLTNTGVWELVGQAYADKTITNVEIGKTYTFKVVSVNANGLKSDFDSSPTITKKVTGYTLIPKTPEQLSIIFTDTCEISWKPVSEVSYYELRSNINKGTDAGLIVKTKDCNVKTLLSSRKGELFLFAANPNGYSQPTSITYYKAPPTKPTDVTVTAAFQKFIVSVGSLGNCKGISVKANDGQKISIYFSPNNTLTVSALAGIYDVQVAYVDLFGEGDWSDSVQVVVKAQIDSSLLAAEAISLEKMDATIKDTLDKGKKSYESTVNIVSELNKPAGQCGYTAIAQTNQALQLRAEKDKLISLLNICPEAITLASKLIHISGDTVIDNNVITNGMITGKAVSADKMDVSSLSAICATIGTLRTKTTGARVEIADNLIKVYDENNTLRVQLGVW